MTYSNGVQTYDVEMDGDRVRLLNNSWHLHGVDPLVGTYVNASDAITVDGHWRNVIVINGQFPGPDIEVMEGSKVRALLGKSVKKKKKKKKAGRAETKKYT